MCPSTIEGDRASWWDRFLNRWIPVGEFLQRTAVGLVLGFLGILAFRLGIPHDRTGVLNLASYILIFVGTLLVLASQPTKDRPKKVLGIISSIMSGLVMLIGGIALQFLVNANGGSPTLASDITYGGGALFAFGVVLFLTGIRRPPPIQPLKPRFPSTTDASTEWKETRDLILALDGRRHEVRKYGISFVAGLLTAQAIIGSSSTTIPHDVKFAVLMATFVLIVAMRLMEEDYQHFIEGAVKRALELEDFLKMQLTERIQEKYVATKDLLYMDAVYGFTAVAAGIFGYFLLVPPSHVINKAAAGDILATVLAVAVILYVGHVSYGGPGPDYRITVTPDSISFPAGSAQGYSSTLDLEGLHGFLGTVMFSFPPQQSIHLSIDKPIVALSPKGFAQASCTFKSDTQGSHSAIIKARGFPRVKKSVDKLTTQEIQDMEKTPEDETVNYTLIISLIVT